MSSVTIEEIQNVLLEAISVELGVSPLTLATDRPFTDYGVDSLVAFAVAMELQDVCGLVNLPSTLLWDYPTVNTLAPALWNIVNGRLADTAGVGQ
jgi:acyl carrier protein